jgi:hypothetical protein
MIIHIGIKKISKKNSINFNDSKLLLARKNLESLINKFKH